MHQRCIRSEASRFGRNAGWTPSLGLHRKDFKKSVISLRPLTSKFCIGRRSVKQRCFRRIYREVIGVVKEVLSQQMDEKR